MTRKLIRRTAAAMVTVAALGATGCDRTDKGSGDSYTVKPAGAVGGGSDYHPPNDQPNTSTGNAATTAGSGATNGVVGNETLNWVTGPGNTENGSGTTTRPSGGGNAPAGSPPPSSGSTGGGGSGDVGGQPGGSQGARGG